MCTCTMCVYMCTLVHCTLYIFVALYSVHNMLVYMHMYMYMHVCTMCKDKVSTTLYLP